MVAKIAAANSRPMIDQAFITDQNKGMPTNGATAMLNAS
jgi:hypothetical protein